MNIDAIKAAGDNKFSEFSDAVKTELKSKLANHPEVNTYTSDFEKIQQMKTMFSQINTDFGNQETDPGEE